MQKVSTSARICATIKNAILHKYTGERVVVSSEVVNMQSDDIEWEIMSSKMRWTIFCPARIHN